ncbi:MAG: PilZ domain-containing protein [Calditrichia bacterium]
MKKSDHRKSDRVEAKHFISYDLLDSDGKVTENGMALSLDLSREGVLLENRTNFPVNAQVDVHIAVGDEVLHLRGTVRHANEIEEQKYHIGIRFEDMTNEKAEKLAQFYPGILK